jgi:hypothetical protein
VAGHEALVIRGRRTPLSALAGVSLYVCKGQAAEEVVLVRGGIRVQDSKADSTIRSSMSNDFLRVRLDHGLPHLAAKFIKPPILSSPSVRIILSLKAVLL